MFCPDTESSKCVRGLCPAYGYKQPSLCECTICKQQFSMGGSCSEDGHKRTASVIKEYPYCKKYNVVIHPIE